MTSPEREHAKVAAERGGWGKVRGMLYSLREQLSFEIDEANLPIRSEQIRARLRSYPRMVAARSAVTLMVLGLM